jgi:hypothetical protein
VGIIAQRVEPQTLLPAEIGSERRNGGPGTDLFFADVLIGEK